MAKTAPRFTSPAAATTSSGRMWLSVPIWSSPPQRPQFFRASAAAKIAGKPSLMSIRSLLAPGRLPR